MKLAEFLQKRRKELDENQETIADRGGLDRSYVSLVERGFIRQPSPQKLAGLAKGYQVPIEDLWGLTSDYKKPHAGELPEPQEYFRNRYHVNDTFAHHMADVIDALVLVHRRHESNVDNAENIDPSTQLRTMVLPVARSSAIAYCS